MVDVDSSSALDDCVPSDDIPMLFVHLEALSAAVAERRPPRPLPFACAWLLLQAVQAAGPTPLLDPLLEVLQEVASLGGPGDVQDVLALLQAHRGPTRAPEALHQPAAVACSLTPRPLHPSSNGRRAPESHRISDGLECPTLLHMALEPFFPADYHPAHTIEDFLRRLPPDPWAPEAIAQLLDDFRAHEAHTNAALADTHHLDDADRLAVFAYTYEMKASELHTIRPLEGPGLQEHVEHVLCNLEGANLSPHFWSAQRWTGDILLATASEITQGSTTPTVLPNDAITLRRLWHWLQSPEAMVSRPSQLYREVNSAMRGFESSKQAIEPYLPFIYHTRNAMLKLPRPGDSQKQAYFVVYRGLDVSMATDLYRPGSTICWPAFSSTSASAEVAKSFLGGKTSGTLFILEVLTARDVSWLSQFPAEAEFLLPPQSLFRVKGHASAGLRQILGVPDTVQIIELRELREDETQVEFLMAEASRTYKALQKAEATRKYDAAWKQYPDTAIGCFCKGMALAWDRLGVLKPPEEEPEAYFARMREECIGWFVRALEKEGTHPLLLTHYAFALHRRGDNASAKLNFLHALQVDPWLTDALHGLALVAVHTRDFADLPRIAPLYIRCVLLDLAAFVKRGDIAAARGGAQRVYLADQAHAEANELLACFHRQLGEEDQLQILLAAQDRRRQSTGGVEGPDPYCALIVQTNKIADNPFWLYHCALVAQQPTQRPPVPRT